MKNFVQITEGATKLFVPDLSFFKKKELAPVFYNPVFAEDRNLSVKIFSKFLRKGAHAADVLCGTGARGIRYANECGFDVELNDISPAALKVAKKNAMLNKVKAKFSLNEANRFLMQPRDKKFDLIDIDPFGSPVYFFESSLKAVKPKNSLIAVSATDLGTLAGYFPKACFMRYGITAKETAFKHELGLRNLIASYALHAMKYDFSIEPLFAYNHEHYYRAYLKIKPSNKIENIGYYLCCEKCGSRKAVNVFASEEKCECGHSTLRLGPTYTGKLGDSAFMKSIDSKFVNAGELDIAEPYYDLHFIFSKVKKPVPKTEKVIEKLREKGYKACRTLLCGHAVKTNAPLKEII